MSSASEHQNNMRGTPMVAEEQKNKTLLFRSFPISPEKTEDEVVVYTDLLQYLLCNQRTAFANQVCLPAARGALCGSLWPVIHRTAPGTLAAAWTLDIHRRIYIYTHISMWWERPCSWWTYNIEQCCLFSQQRWLIYQLFKGDAFWH